jgi:hypothetical protein
MASAYRSEDFTHDPVRRIICSRIAELGRDFRALSLGELGRRVESIVQLARFHHVEPAQRLAEGFAAAVARDGRAAIVEPYLEGLRAATECDPRDPLAGDVILASVNVRLAN